MPLYDFWVPKISSNSISLNFELIKVEKDFLKLAYGAIQAPVLRRTKNVGTLVFLQGLVVALQEEW